MIVQASTSLALTGSQISGQSMGTAGSVEVPAGVRSLLLKTNLRPICDPGDDAKDESLAWLSSSPTQKEFVRTIFEAARKGQGFAAWFMSTTA